MGYSYNGYYTRLLICEIRVRIPGGPLTLQNIGTWLSWLERLSDTQEIGGSIPPVPTITGGSSTGEFKKQNPVRDFDGNDR